MAKSGYRKRRGQEDLTDLLAETKSKPRRRPIPKFKESTEFAKREEELNKKMAALAEHIVKLDDYVKQLKRYTEHRHDCNLSELAEAGRLPTFGKCTCGLEKILEKKL